MATLETQILDDVIVRSRRKMLALGGTALAALMVGATKSAQAATYTDADILNFALNLEYLEANFYYLAAFGTTIDKPNAASMAAGGPTAGIPITGSVGTAGTVTTVGAGKVPFTNISVSAYANETAIEEGKHVLFLQGALGTSAVAQPAINLGTSWQMLGGALTPSAPTFNPYLSDATFLLGAYVFEDVGVTAYHGAASLLTVSGNLTAAAGILGVEAYHAGLVRTTINILDPTGTALIPVTTSISTLRAALAKAAASSTANPYDANPDDFGVAPFTVSLAGATGVSATRLVDADATNVIAFSRTTTQVLNIVTGGGAINATTGAVVSPATGIFFPVGLNAGPNGFK